MGVRFRSVLLMVMALSVSALASSGDTRVLTVDTARPAATVDENYLSFALDTAQVSGGKWWDSSLSTSGGRGSHPVPPFDFTPPRLKALARALAPAYLRIGGSEADLAYYDMGAGTAALPHDFESRITRERYDAVFGFARDAGLKLFFDLNAGPGNRGHDGAWNPANALELMRYASQSHQWPAAWEFGNEVNAFWLIQGLSHQISAHRYSEDYRLARATLQSFDSASKLAGPASAYWPWLGEPLAFFFGEMKDFLGDTPRGSVDVVTWHFYPTESQRCGLAVRRASSATLIEPRTLNEVRHWAEQVASLRDAYQPQAALWLGESGSAQCGGEPGASDGFASSFWWLDELGTLARLGHSVVIRQTLTGSDYGMIRSGDWEPRPDFWASLLWKRLMGTRVLDVGGTELTGTLRAYAHCTPGSYGAPRGAVTVLLLNLSRDRAEHVSLGAFAGSGTREYAVSAANLESSQVRLGGLPLKAGAAGEIPELVPVAHAAVAGQAPAVDVAPLSYSFVVVEDAHAAGCAN